MLIKGILLLFISSLVYAENVLNADRTLLMEKLNIMRHERQHDSVPPRPTAVDILENLALFNGERNRYCARYSDKYENYCAEGKETDPREVVRTFCPSYKRSCQDQVYSAEDSRETRKETVAKKKLSPCTPDCKEPHCTHECKCDYLYVVVQNFCTRSAPTFFVNTCRMWHKGCSHIAKYNHTSKLAKDVTKTHEGFVPQQEYLHDDPTHYRDPRQLSDKPFPVLPSDAHYGTQAAFTDFNSLTDSHGIAHRPRSRSPFSKPGLWEPNPDDPHNRDHANKWWYYGDSITADWLNGQLNWGSHWAVPAAGVGGTDGYSALHFPSIGQFLNIPDDYDT